MQITTKPNNKKNMLMSIDKENEDLSAGEYGKLSKYGQLYK